ncbi:MAG: hypothetical protein D4S01_10165 [Dehalococcoidia bacterium]|nr:MAG: hypothetical protein D4S01_10165 [Dehalococcoidia bacterium]
MDYAEQGSSVEFPANDPYTIITIGADFDSWSEVFDGILHEMVELHMLSMELGYQRWHRAGCDSGDIWFHMPHAEYSEAISRASQSILCFIELAEKDYVKYRTKLNAVAKKKQQANETS